MPVVADALDPDQVAVAVRRARPEVIVHQLTAIPAKLDLRHFDRDFALTNRLRSEGTDHLLSAGQAVGVRRFVAQSNGAFPYARTGGPGRRARRTRSTRRRRARSATAWPRSVTSRRRSWAPAGPRGSCCATAGSTGPAPSLAPGAEQVELVRRRKFPLVGDGGGVWSFIHVADAADATVAAVEHGGPRYLQRRRRRPGPGRRVAAGAGGRARSEAADARAAIRRATVRRTGTAC